MKKYEKETTSQQRIKGLNDPKQHSGVFDVYRRLSPRWDRSPFP